MKIDRKLNKKKYWTRSDDQTKPKTLDMDSCILPFSITYCCQTRKSKNKFSSFHDMQGKEPLKTEKDIQNKEYRRPEKKTNYSSDRGSPEVVLGVDM